MSLLLAAAPAAAQSASPPAGAVSASGGAVTPATVMFWNRPIVTFRAVLRQHTPEDRARTAERRLALVPHDLPPERIRAERATVGELTGVLVYAGPQVLLAILPEDLDPTAAESLDAVSQRVLEQLRDALRARAQQHRLPVLLWGIGLSLAATALFAVVLWMIMRAGARARERIRQATHERILPRLWLGFRPFLDSMERALVRLTTWGLSLVAGYLWLTFVLRRFAYTQPWGDRLAGHLVGLLTELGLGAVYAMPGLFAVVIIFLATRFAVRLVNWFFQAVETGAIVVGPFPADTARATRLVATVLIWLFALTVAYRYMPGAETDAFKAVGVFAGLMISLGSAGLVSQIMSGLVVAYSRALKPGELVQAGDTAGLVSEVGFLSTKLVTVRREEITIPNAVLAGSTVTNYSRLAGADGAIVATRVTIGYDAPWRQVHALLALAAERTPGTRRTPAPYVMQRALSDFYVEYELRVHIERPEDRFRVLSDLHAQIQDAFNEFGVQIMSPAFESQPDRPVVVPRARWHAAPAVEPRPAGLDAPS
jgi:small-conductance mechanosensitive channel